MLTTATRTSSILPQASPRPPASLNPMRDADAPPHLATDPAPAARKRRGNPNLGLALRCGARTRAGCPCRAPAIRGKRRCRMHGGRSTGPRTAEGLARLRQARTIHGRHGAEARACHRNMLAIFRRGQVLLEAVRCIDRLPPELAARLNRMPPALMPPPCPSGELSRAEDRALMRAEAAALAPWKQAIAAATAARRCEAAARLGAGAIAAILRSEPHAPEARSAASAASHESAPRPHAAPEPPHLPRRPRTRQRQRRLESTSHATAGVLSRPTPPHTGSLSPATAAGSACQAARMPPAGC
jgi:hypothetical protein